MKEITDRKLLKVYMEKYGLIDIFDEKVISECRLFEYEKGDHIVDIGMTLHYLKFLVKGSVKIYTTLENGKNYLLRIETPMNVYGDVEVLNDEACTAYVKALRQCHIIGVPAGLIRSKYVEHPPFLRFLVNSLAARLVKISYKSTDNVLLPLKNKLAGFIVAHLNEGDLLKIESSYTDVAAQLGTTYRHLSRTVKELCEEGIIEKEGRRIRVLDMSALEDLAGDSYIY